MAIFTRLSDGTWGICLDRNDRGPDGGPVNAGARVYVTKRNGRSNAVTAVAFVGRNSYGEEIWTFANERAATPNRGVPVVTAAPVADVNVAEVARREAETAERAVADRAERERLAEIDREARETARRSAERVAVAAPTTEAAEFAALGFPRVAPRAPVPAPVAAAPRISAAEIVAGAAADGHGALTGWRGDGALPRTEILAALRDAGLPEDWAPASKSSEGHAGKACGDRNLSGYVVRRVKARDLPRWARTLKARWELFRATGDRSTLLTVDLHTDGRLSSTPDATREEEALALFAGIAIDYEGLRGGEIYEAGDVTAWLSRVLRTRCGAIAFGVGYYLPNPGRPVATAIVSALSARWGSGWINPLLPVATSTELRSGVARSLVEEVAGIARALETSREAARKASPPKSEIGPGRAATLIKELEAVHERVGAYRLLCGNEIIRPVVAEIAALLVTLTPLTNDTSVRFALLDIPAEVAAAPVAEGPSLAERAAEAAAERRRAPETRVIDGETYEVLRAPVTAPSRVETAKKLGDASAAIANAIATKEAPPVAKRPPTEPPAERTSTDERFSLLELD